ncbi:M28 family peptidase [Brachybacterium phenoliresistens]|uniref:Vacuolar membrane protease n=1 Tax=Brachybacterium phenoliresistens TaxID=396014 RepID=Z9JXX1_9MICO|nr:M28 family peptidase [Brachybacterium phenoliresistens]EWS82627.1 aminopeptidase [Brachybacterium phenoliresistens]
MRIRPGIVPSLLMLVLVLASAGGLLSRGTAAPRDASAPSTVFSAERAAEAVAPVVAVPRPVGSAANAEARAVLAERLEARGFTVEEHEGLGTRAVDDWAVAGYTHSLVATRPGTDPTGTVVLATHIDSVVGAPGAADAGVGLAVILESVRALGDEGRRNDLVVLLVDGEEDGLLGAAAFMDDGSQELRAPVVVLNHEARGTSGRPIVTRTAGPLHEVLPAMPRPEAESLSDALFEIVPNDTDFTEYRDGGWWGADMALIGGSWAYHSPQDTAENLDPSALQHYGDMSLALSQDLLDRDLGELSAAASQSPVMTTMPWGILSVPEMVIRIAAALLILGSVAAVVRARRREAARTGRIALAALLGLLALCAASAAAIGSWMLIASVLAPMTSATVGEPVRPGGLLAAEIALAAAAVSGAWLLARRRGSGAEAATGAAVLLGLLVGVPGLMLPSLLGWLVLPMSLAVILSTLAHRAEDQGARAPAAAGARRAVALGMRVVALAGLGWMLGTQLSTLADFGIASSAGALAGSAVLVLLAAGAVLPTQPAGTPDPTSPATSSPPRVPAAVSPGARRGSGRSRPALLVGVPLIAALALTGAGIARSLDAPHPVQERVSAEVSAQDGSTRWTVRGVTPWGQRLASRTGTSGLAGPEVQVQDAGEGRVRLAVTSRREARTLELRAEGGMLRAVRVEGAEIEDPDGARTLVVTGISPGRTVEIEADVSALDGLTVLDQSDDPSEAAGWSDPGPEISVVQPRVRVAVEVPLEVS